MNVLVVAACAAVLSDAEFMCDPDETSMGHGNDNITGQDFATSKATCCDDKTYLDCYDIDCADGSFYPVSFPVGGPYNTSTCCTDLDVNGEHAAYVCNYMGKLFDPATKEASAIMYSCPDGSFLDANKFSNSPLNDTQCCSTNAPFEPTCGRPAEDTKALFDCALPSVFSVSTINTANPNATVCCEDHIPACDWGANQTFPEKMSFECPVNTSYDMGTAGTPAPNETLCCIPWATTDNTCEHSNRWMQRWTCPSGYVEKAAFNSLGGGGDPASDLVCCNEEPEICDEAYPQMQCADFSDADCDTMSPYWPMMRNAYDGAFNDPNECCVAGVPTEPPTDADAEPTDESTTTTVTATITFTFTAALTDAALDTFTTAACDAAEAAMDLGPDDVFECVMVLVTRRLLADVAYELSVTAEVSDAYVVTDGGTALEALTDTAAWPASLKNSIGDAALPTVAVVVDLPPTSAGGDDPTAATDFSGAFANTLGCLTAVTIMVAA